MNCLISRTVAEDFSRYTPPEAATQSRFPIPQELLPRCDIWAYGLLVWEILANGAEYFDPEWRRNPKYARSETGISSATSANGGDTNELEVDSDLQDNTLVEDIKTVFGSFDRRHTKDLARAYLQLVCPRQSFEKSYLGPLFNLTLDEDPRKRPSNLWRSPVISHWNQSAKESSLQSHLALHTGSSEANFDMFRPERGFNIMWEHQVQIMKASEALANEENPGPRLASTSFQLALCYITGFGCSIQFTLANQYLCKAVELEHEVAKLFSPPLTSVLTSSNETRQRSWQSLLSEGFEQQRKVIRGKEFWLSHSPNGEEEKVAVEFPKACTFEAIYEAAVRRLSSSSKTETFDVRDCFLRFALHQAKISWIDLAIDLGASSAVTGYLPVKSHSPLAHRDGDDQDVDLKKSDPVGESLLLQACRKGRVEIAQSLLRRGADPTVKTEDNCTILHWLFCFDESHPETAALLERIFEATAGRKDLVEAMCTKTYTLSAQWPLELCGTPLAFAVIAGSKSVVKLLLDAGADPRAAALPMNTEETTRLWTAMHLAVKYNFHQILTMLCHQVNAIVRTYPRERLGWKGLLPAVGSSEYDTAINRASLGFPNFQLACALSYLTVVERYAVHGQYYEERLSSTIKCLPDEILGWQDANGMTPLIQAIDFQDVHVVRAILRTRPDLATTSVRDPLDEQSFTSPLHFAAEIGSKYDTEDALRIPAVIISTAPKSVMLYDTKQRMALHIAVTGNSARFSQYLLEKGARVDPQNLEGQTPLLVAESAANIAVLLAKGAIKDHRDKEGLSAAHHACLRGSEECVQELTKHGFPINLNSHNHGTALHCAVKRRAVGCIGNLLLARASMDVQDLEGNTPFHLAVLSSRLDIVQSLLVYNPNLHVVNNDGFTAIDSALGLQSDKIFKAILMYQVASARRSDLVATLHACSRYGTKAAMETVLQEVFKAGMSANTVDGTSSSPLHSAAETACAAVILPLISVGADLDRKDASGSTPLLLACAASLKRVYLSKGNKTLFCERLCAAGANMLCKNRDGQTAWWHARDNEDFGVMRCLLQFCPNPEALDALIEPAPIDLRLVQSAIEFGHFPFIVACLRFCTPGAAERNKLVIRQKKLLFLRAGESETIAAALLAFAKVGDRPMIENTVLPSARRGILLDCAYQCSQQSGRPGFSFWGRS